MNVFGPSVSSIHCRDLDSTLKVDIRHKSQMDIGTQEYLHTNLVKGGILVGLDPKMIAR